ncbi:hypothetical protein [Scleromatobacter humisilvae]|uniref:Uncharacterized protein n=1 Tax=Scleromatobacter humisilvae TaxID=2897159 RepID=A0A9X1YQN8_9BURK|nr:hypothetical protein [Scleromatobacter humisilvae]MCK9689287.1 hypothetical protein [Scleromatobacter humisilvae]
MTLPIPLRAAALACALVFSHAAFADPVPTEDPGFTDAITEQLRTALPDEHVIVVGPQRLTIGNAGFTVNLGRLFQACRANAAKCDESSARYVAGVTQAFQDMNKPPAPAQVRIAVRSARMAQAYMDSTRATGLALQVQPFVEGLVSTVVIDSPASLRWASSKDMEALKLDAAGLRELARSNTHASLQPLASVAQPAAKGKLGTIDGDAYTASRILFPADWAAMAKAQDGVLIVAVPLPTEIIYTGDESAHALDALRTLAHQQMAASPGGISDRLLRWTPEGWKTLP